jgi:hypothetical protein
MFLMAAASFGPAHAGSTAFEGEEAEAAFMSQ